MEEVHGLDPVVGLKLVGQLLLIYIDNPEPSGSGHSVPDLAPRVYHTVGEAEEEAYQGQEGDEGYGEDAVEVAALAVMSQGRCHHLEG